MSATTVHEESGREDLVSDPLPQLAVGVLIALCAVKLLLHLFTSVLRYGYFRDELYYLDMARHLDWGYVDQPPPIASIARLGLAVLGDSLSAIRLPAALQGLAALCLALAPGVLAMDHSSVPL